VAEGTVEFLAKEKQFLMETGDCGDNGIDEEPKEALSRLRDWIAELAMEWHATDCAWRCRLRL
jgi:hypothetical protein